MLVVRFRHLAPIAPCPRPNVGISRTTSNDKVLVAFLNLTFVRRDCGIGDTNVKFTPLGGMRGGIGLKQAFLFQCAVPFARIVAFSGDTPL
jgi:hypothetical protein